MKLRKLTPFFLAVLPFVANAELVSQQELDNVKKSNQELIDKAMAGYKKGSHSTINLGNIPKPQVQWTGSISKDITALNNNLKDIDLSMKPKSKLKLFVSFSVPEESLKRYVNEAAKIGRDNITLVMIGLKKDSSMRQTSSAIGQLTKGHDVAVDIDPPSFERFGIKQVPALVAYYDDPLYEAKCAVSGQPEKMSVMEHWEGTYGDVSIQYSIDKLLDNPESEFKPLLEPLLVKLKGIDL